MSSKASSSNAPLPQESSIVQASPLPSTTSSRSQHSPTMPRPPSTSSSLHHPSNLTHSTLPHSPETQRQIAEARAALEASMNNIGSSLDVTLRTRAQNLHDNSKQLDKQQKDMVKATESLRKENEKLKKVAEEGSKKVKELGNVQNWAEMLERDFLVLSETLRLANGSGSESYTESEGSWETESEGMGPAEPWWKEGGEEEDLGLLKYVSPLDPPVDGDGDTAMEEVGEQHKVDEGIDKGKQIATDTITETASLNQQDHAAGGSSTDTAGSTSDPSSSSIHTAASGTS